jgi:hypothetical protein
MKKEVQDRLIYELIVSVTGTLVFLGIWYLAEMPEWKRKELLAKVRRMATGKRPHPDMFILQVMRLRSQISRWEHEQAHPRTDR